MASALEQTAGLLPVVEEITGLSAWEACRRLADLPHLLFLDSAHQSEAGRYSFVMADPVAWLTSAEHPGRDPFAPMRDLLPRRREDAASVSRHGTCDAFLQDPALPPFQGGVAGLWGYDLCHWVEDLPRPRFDDFRVPEMALGLYDWVLAWDHERGRAWLISTGVQPADSGQDVHARERRAWQRRDAVMRWLEPPAPLLPHQEETPLTLAAPVLDVSAVAHQHGASAKRRVYSNFDEASYLRTIARAIDYVHAGDCFQVNIAQRLLTAQRELPLALYERLRQRNAAPFAGYLDLGDLAIASASPERFLRMEHGRIETRPIKGTRPRGFNPAEDMYRGEDLRTSDKDRAENVMIVDLLRNDLGRVCDYGSVQVEDVCRLESFRYVHHLVSQVCGRLRQGLDAVDLLRATFPGGSITGAPKVRAMQIITELEQTARGAYCGCLGYVGLNGTMDTNLLIRTFTVGKGWVQFSVGGGIVADSDPRREYEETWHKAAGLLRALEQ